MASKTDPEWAAKQEAAIKQWREDLAKTLEDTVKILAINPNGITIASLIHRLRIDT